jgi:hypothetical protein
LLCEAMLNNFQFADMVTKALSFYRDHVPTCPTCQAKHFGHKAPEMNWIFSHPTPGQNG